MAREVPAQVYAGSFFAMIAYQYASFYLLALPPL